MTHANPAPEAWVPVISYNGRFRGAYEVSSRGHARSLDRIDSRGRRLRGKVLRLRPGQGGYLRVGLYWYGEQQDAYIHRLVAEAFLGPCPEGQEVRHGPAGKLDNSVGNLSYGPHIANCEDRTRDRLPRARLTRATALRIRQRVAAGEPRASVASAYGVNVSTVCRVVTGSRWRAAS